MVRQLDSAFELDGVSAGTHELHAIDDLGGKGTAEGCLQLGGQWEFELQSEIDRTIELVARAEAHTDLDLTSFHGCYDMSFFTLVETRPL